MPEPVVNDPEIAQGYADAIANVPTEQTIEEPVVEEEVAAVEETPVVDPSRPLRRKKK